MGDDLAGGALAGEVVAEDRVVQAAGGELTFPRHQLVHLLLAQHLAEVVGFVGGEPGQGTSRLHHLLLVNQDPVGFAGNVLHGRVFVDHWLNALAALEVDLVQVCVLHAGTHDGQQGSHIDFVAGPHLHRHAGQLRCLHLEDPGGLPLVDLIPDGRVGELLRPELLAVSDADVVQPDAVPLMHQFPHRHEGVEVPQAQQVELDRP